MTPGTRLTNMFMARCGELWPTTVRLWRSNAGSGVGMSVVYQAIALMEAGNIEAAKTLLKRPVSFGVSGGCDLTGFVVREAVWEQNYGGTVAPQKIARFLGVEIKASKSECVSDVQQEFHDFVMRYGGLILVVRDLEQGLRDLSVHAGPGVGLKIPNTPRSHAIACQSSDHNNERGCSNPACFKFSGVI